MEAPSQPGADSLAAPPSRKFERFAIPGSSPTASASKRGGKSKTTCSRGCGDGNDVESDDSSTIEYEGAGGWDISRINKHWEIDTDLRRSLPSLARVKRGANESAASKFLRLTKLPCPASSTTSKSIEGSGDAVEVDASTGHSPVSRPASQARPTTAFMTPEVKAKYFGGSASKSECYAIFRKLAKQKYLVNAPLGEFVERHQHGGSWEESRVDTAERLLDSDDDGAEERETSGHQSPGKNTRQRNRKRNQRQRNDLASSTAPEVVPPLSVGHERPLATTSSSSYRSQRGHTRRDLHPEDDNRHGLFATQLTARHKFASLCLDRDLPPCLRLIIRNYFAPEINVSHMAMGDELAQVFAACLLELPMVTALNVRNNRLADDGLRAIIDVIVSKHDLNHVDLSENKVDGAASAALATYLGSPKCSLQGLKLARADVDDDELAAFTRALHSNKSLLLLDVSNNLIGSSETLNVVRPSIITGGEALATMLSINHTLTSLDLSWNYIRLGGAVELGKALAYNSSLRELHLAYNAFGDAGAQAIGESLLANGSLVTLNLAYNNIPAQGAVTIANALKANGHALLSTLNLDGNPLGQTGGRAMLHAVAARPERRLNVSLEGCNFDLTSTDSFDPAEATGSYDLNMEVPYERAIALELLRVANTKQGCKFLSITHVTGPGGKQKRSIKVELREIDGSDARRRLLKTAGIVTDAALDTQRERASQLDREKLLAVFAELDKDSSGFIDEEELRIGLRKLQLTLSDDDIPRYIALYDVDGTGTIEFEEFAELIASFNLEADHFPRQCVDVETNRPFEIPADGRLLIDFADFHVSADQDNAHSREGVERLIENINASKNKGQMLGMAKSGLYFRANEAQLLLETVADAFETAQAVMLLLPNMVDPKHAYTLIDQNLDSPQRVRVQHLMGSALSPILGLSTGHYRLDLSVDMDRLTIKKLVENSNRTAFLRKKAGLKDTSQHGNHHGFRNETLNGKSMVLDPGFLDTMPKFGTLEFDYVQLGRPTPTPRASSTKRLAQVVDVCQLLQMGSPMGVRSGDGRGGSKSMGSSRAPASPASRSAVLRSGVGSRGSAKSMGGEAKEGLVLAYTAPYPPLRMSTKALFAELACIKTTSNYIKFGVGMNRTIELQPRPSTVTSDSVDSDANALTALVASPTTERKASPAAEPDEDEEEDGERAASTTSRDPTASESSMANAAEAVAPLQRETCTARRLLFNLQWCLATHWITVQHAVTLLSLWPEPFASSRCDFVCMLFDRIVDLHNFNGVLSALTDVEAAQCIYRLGWLNIWTPLMPDNYYELELTQYEEREVAKALVRLAIDEPGENWQGESFGWTRSEPIPGWELNMSWLKDGGFPEKGFLSLEYYSGADKGCGPVWPTRKELAAGTLPGLPDDVEQLVLYVDSRSMMSRQRQRSV